MKKISIIVSVIVFTILSIAVVIILNFTNGDIHEDVLKNKTRVGFVMNGTADDSSWGQSHYEALARLVDKLNIEVVCRENTPEDETCFDVIKDLVENEDCLIVICNSFGFGEYAVRAAEEYPDRFFLHATGTESGKNLGTYFGRMYQVRYLSGIIAGLKTETGHIGYVASFPISEVNRGINAFTLGVRSVAPDVTVHVSFCGSWTDDDMAESSAEYLINECSADVIAMHTDSLAPLYAADRNGVWSVGYNCDNSDKFPDSYLAACVWDWEGYYYDQILSCLQGKFRGEHQWLDMESGIVKLVEPTDTGNAFHGYEEALRTVQKKFEDHSFDVFYGPVYDNEGELRIEDGESMSDDNMLNNFDWYAEGVVIE